MVDIERCLKRLASDVGVAMPTPPCWLPCASRRECSGSGGPSKARPATPFVLQVADALAERLLHPYVGPGSRGAAVVAVGATQAGI
jgi:hypothetical protein